MSNRGKCDDDTIVVNSFQVEYLSYLLDRGPRLHAFEPLLRYPLAQTKSCGSQKAIPNQTERKKLYCEDFQTVSGL